MPHAAGPSTGYGGNTPPYPQAIVLLLYRLTPDPDEIESLVAFPERPAGQKIPDLRCAVVGLPGGPKWTSGYFSHSYIQELLTRRLARPIQATAADLRWPGSVAGVAGLGEELVPAPKRARPRGRRAR